MTLIYNKRLGDVVPHEIMGYHSWGSVSDMGDFIVRTELDNDSTPVFGLEIETSRENRFTQNMIDKMFEIFQE